MKRTALLKLLTRRGCLLFREGSRHSLFWNPANRDFHLKAGSKGIGGGTKMPLEKDIDGKARPADGRFTLGVYEH